MLIEKIEIVKIQPNELKTGHKILNVGIVKSVEEWTNVYEVYIHSGCLYNAHDKIVIPKYDSIIIDCVDGKPCIY